jgi:signal transduction histidine kinase
MDFSILEGVIEGVHFDLIGVGVAVLGVLVLAWTVLYRSRNSITSRSFMFFSFVTILWGLSNYFLYKFTDPADALLALRFHIFLSIWHAYAFFQLAYVFPNEQKVLPPWHRYVLLPLAFFTSTLLLIPFVFREFSNFISPEETISPEKSQGIILAGIVTISFFAAGIIILFKRIGETKGDERRQVMLMFTGMSLTAGLLLLFSFILPIGFKNFDFVPYGALFIFPVIVFTAYAIYIVELFHVKNIFAGLFTFFLCVVSLIELILAETVEQLLLRILVFLLTIVIGIQLVRNTFEIELANEQKSELMSFATHEIRTPITVMRGYATMLLDGDKGEISRPVKDLLQKIMIAGNDVTTLLAEYLDKSKIELGQMEYIPTKFDVVNTINEILAIFKIHAEQKGLTLTPAITTSRKYFIYADQAKLKEVVINIIDNSIKYTPQGSIDVTVSSRDGYVVIKVADTGVGIEKEVMPSLFKEFSRADLQKVNILGSGLGLYLAKKFTEAQKGKVWAESDGKDKGSQFYIKFPEVKNS